MSAILLETEKSFNIQETGFFTLIFDDLSFKTNKIELAKVLKLAGLDVVKINSIQPYFKKKKRNSKKRVSVVLVKRPRKFMIKLKIGQIITPENIEFINQKMGFVS